MQKRHQKRFLVSQTLEHFTSYEPHQHFDQRANTPCAVRIAQTPPATSDHTARRRRLSVARFPVHTNGGVMTTKTSATTTAHTSGTTMRRIRVCVRGLSPL